MLVNRHCLTMQLLAVPFVYRSFSARVLGTSRCPSNASQTHWPLTVDKSTMNKGPKYAKTMYGGTHVVNADHRRSPSVQWTVNNKLYEAMLCFI